MSTTISFRTKDDERFGADPAIPGKSFDYDWPQWRKHLKQRLLVSPAELAPFGKVNPLLWSPPNQLTGSDTLSLLKRAPRPSGKKNAPNAELLQTWLAEADRRELSPTHAYDCLAWCQILPTAAKTLGEDLWWRLLRQLVSVADDAVALSPDESPLLHQILAGELPLTLAYLFPEVEHCRLLGQEAAEQLARGPIELLDGEGLPHAGNLHLLRPLLACWTRSLLISRAAKQPCFTPDAEEQYGWMVRRALQLLRSDGSQMLGAGVEAQYCKPLLQTALELSHDPEDNELAKCVLPGGPGASKYELPEPAMASEWAETYLLRPEMSPRGERFLITHDEERFVCELSARNEILLLGEAIPEVTVNGQRLQAVGDWEEVCWISDDDADFLELEIELENGWCVQRQAVLAREDRFLFLADAVLRQTSSGKNSDHADAEIHYRTAWPLGDGISVAAEDETNELRLSGKKHLATVLPLALSEWKRANRRQSFQHADHGLELKQQAVGRGLYAPLFLDLNPRRGSRPVTWRQLTVAEQLEIAPPEVAAAFRIQIGHEQWVAYRSLAPPAARTFLGHHLSSEFLVGQFDYTGEVEVLVEIE